MSARSELSLGRVLGIRVSISWGLLLVSALVTLTLALDQYPTTFPGHGPWRYWAAAAATTALFALSILGHELGHALVARGEQVGVEGVTLWMFGGVARLSSPPRTAAAEARIALAGPAATGVASGIFWLLAAATDSATVPTLSSAMFDWLARTNVLLLALNLLPALPLDGGRVLGATVWGATGSAELGETVASRAGWLVGAALGLLGLLQLRNGASGAIWALVIAAFVLGASIEHERRRRLSEELRDRVVGDVMRPTPAVVDGWMNIEQLLVHGESITASRHQDVLLVRGEDGAVHGVVRLSVALAVPVVARAGVTVSELLEPRRDVPVVRVDESLLSVIASHPETGRGTVMVVDHAGNVVGVIGPDSLIRRSRWAGGSPVRFGP